MIVGDVESAGPGSPDGIVDTTSGSTSGVRLDQQVHIGGQWLVRSIARAGDEDDRGAVGRHVDVGPVTIGGAVSDAGASDTGANASASSWTPSIGSST